MNLITEQLRQDVESHVRSIMEDTHARGIAAAVIDAQGKTLYQNFFGYKDAEEKSAINEDTLFGLASVTKSFTALAIMQMAEDGILSLEDPITKYVPRFTNKNQEQPVLIRHLLSHAGGYFPLTRLCVPALMQELGVTDTLDNELIYNDAFVAEALRRVATRMDEQTVHAGRPGEVMSYCNDGFGVLSEIIHLYGDCNSYAEYLDRHILQPLGMSRSGCSFIRSSQDANVATLYTEENGTSRADKDFTNEAFILNGGGAMKSTLRDLKQYVAMYLNEGVGLNGAKVANEYVVHEMMKPRQQVKPGEWYGYGLEWKMIGDMTVAEHGGSLPGVSSHIAWSPEEGIGVIVLCNTMSVPVYSISDALLRAFAGLPILETRQEHVTCDWSDEYKQQIVGEYAMDEGEAFSLSLAEDGQIVMMQNGKQQPFQPVYPRTGLVRKKYSDMYVQFLETRERGVFAARFGTRIFPKR